LPSAKTEATEISFAFGILGVDDPFNLIQDQIEYYFNNTLSTEKYLRFKNEFYQKNELLYQNMFNVGFKLRANYSLFKKIDNLYWSGPERQAITTSAAKDLLVGNTPVSVKAKSNVVLNPSPYNLFYNIPRGIMPAQDSPNWFLELCPEDYQKLYDFTRTSGLKYLPDKVDEFELIAKKKIVELYKML